MNPTLLCSLIVLLAVCGAQATAHISKASASLLIVNGTATTRFSEVGAMVIRATSSDPWTTGCTGTLISPTVFLTAGHCTVIWDGLEWGVSFDPVINAPSVITDGTWYRHPDFIFPDVVPGFDVADMAFT